MNFLPKLSLTAAVDENTQGWFVGSKLERTDHPTISNFVSGLKTAKNLREAKPAELEHLPNFECLTLGPSDNPPFTDEGQKTLKLHIAGQVFACRDAGEPQNLQKLKQ